MTSKKSIPPSPAVDVMMVRGWLCGKFAMPHMGHINHIHQAATQVKELYVVVSQDDARFKDPRLSLRNRMLWMKTIFKDMPHIKIISVDETGIPGYPNGWQQWSDLVKGTLPNVEFDAVFTSEPADKPNYEVHFKGHTERVVMVDPDRKGVPISATEIRNDMVKHWGMMPTVVRKDFVSKVCVVGTESCVDGETEYHNGLRWKSISEYVPGEHVLQYNEDGSANHILPERYIVEPADQLWLMENAYGSWQQVYSDEHDLVYITSRGNLAKIPFREFRERHHGQKFGFQGNFIATYELADSEESISVDHNWLRLAIAVSADATQAGNRWIIRIKKDRKKDRIKELITAAGYEIKESKDTIPGFARFTLPLDAGTKVFPQAWHRLNSDCRDVFIDEVFKWDGSDHNGDRRYFSTVKSNAELVQFILNSSGVKTKLTVDQREGRSDCWSVSAKKTKYLQVSINKITEKYRERMVRPFTPRDGKKYCFTVPSGMLVLRRGGNIFITGNCGKTSLTKMLAKQFQTSWVEEYGRTYCEQNLCMDESLLTFEDYGHIAAKRYEMEQQAILAANRVMFADTAALSTNFFCLMYEGRENPLVTAYAEMEQYDMFIYLADDVEWVADGLRKNTERDYTRKLFLTMLKAYAARKGIPIVRVSGNYNQRLNKSIEAVRNLLAQPLSLA